MSKLPYTVEHVGGPEIDLERPPNEHPYLAVAQAGAIVAMGGDKVGMVASRKTRGKVSERIQIKHERKVFASKLGVPAG